MPKRVRRTVIAAVIALVTVGITTSANATTRQRLDSAALQQAIDIQPGDQVAGVIARVREGDQRWHGQTADSATGRSIPSNAEFRIGSISKTFEATLALQLTAQHRIDLNRTVQGYLPGLLPNRYRPITVRQLLNMTSGLPGVDEGAPDQANDQLIAHRFDYQTLDQIIEGSLRPNQRPWPKPHFAPGTKQEYSSLNYRIVAKLIEHVTGDSYADELTKRIVRPFNLSHTESADHIRPMPHPYLHGYLTDRHSNLVDVSQQAGDASSMISTMKDVDRFFTGLFTGKVLRPEQLEEMLTIPNVPYADTSNCIIGPSKGRACFGLGVERLELNHGTTLWGKTGTDLGYRSAYFSTLSGDTRVSYAVAQTQPSSGMPPTALRLAKVMGTAEACSPAEAA